MARLTDHRSLVLQGDPIPVQMCGFFTNTYILGGHGWNLAMDESYRDPCADNAVLHHRQLGLSLMARVHGLHQLRGERMGNMMMNRYRSANADRARDAWYMARDENLPHINVIQAGTARSQVIRMPDMRSTMVWRDTDAHYVDSMVSELHELPLFAELYAAPAEGQDLIVDPTDVQTLLDQILATQGPMRREIRARERRREGSNEPEPPRQVHAQIVSLHK